MRYKPENLLTSSSNKPQTSNTENRPRPDLMPKTQPKPYDTLKKSGSGEAVEKR